MVNACTYAWKYVPAAAQRLKMVEGVRIAAVNVAGGRTTARGADETSSSSAEDEEDASSSFFGGGGARRVGAGVDVRVGGGGVSPGAPWPGACDADGTCAIAAQYGGELGRWVYDGPEEGEEAEEEEEESSASSSSSSSLGSDARPRRAAGLGRRPLRGGARSSLPVPASVAKSLKGRPLTTAEAREVVDALARRRSLASLGARPRDGGSDFVGSDFVESDDASSAASLLLLLLPSLRGGSLAHLPVRPRRAQDVRVVASPEGGGLVGLFERSFERSPDCLLARVCAPRHGAKRLRRRRGDGVGGVPLGRRGRARGASPARRAARTRA